MEVEAFDSPFEIQHSNLWPLILGHWLYDYGQFVVVITQKAEALEFDTWLYPVEVSIGAVLSFLLWRDRERPSPAAA